MRQNVLAAPSVPGTVALTPGEALVAPLDADPAVLVRVQGYQGVEAVHRQVGVVAVELGLAPRRAARFRLGDAVLASAR